MEVAGNFAFCTFLKLNEDKKMKCQVLKTDKLNAKIEKTSNKI
jgi:hypothetical protein